MHSYIDRCKYIMKDVIYMTNYREILRLKSLGFSERNIALSCLCSRNTVSSVLKKANELEISWPLQENQTNAVIQSTLFPQESPKATKRLPDYSYVRKELLKNGVTRTLLWTEYMEDCRLN